MDNLSSYIQSSRTSFENMLQELVEIPTVSADPNRASDINRAAEVAAGYLRDAGAEANIHKEHGNPVVIGKFHSPRAKRTITIYNHLDVQPAEEPEWKQDPFVFRKDGDRYFGRGSTDDKGPALVALFASKYAIQSGIPLNIQFIWELEEEIGSPTFADFLRTNAASLKTDSVIVIDSIWISKTQPSLFYALRGNITGSMRLQTSETAVHSGVTGGVAVNPILELGRVAAQLYDPKKGKVLIPGFYEGIQEPTKLEKQNFKRVNLNLNQWAKSYGLKKLQTKNPFEALLRMWCRPTFEVHGVVGGYTGPGIKTAIPGSAEMKFSCRLAPNQDPNKITKLFVKHIKKLNPDIQVHIHGKLSPFLGPFSGPYADAASNAIEKAFSKKPVFLRAGGSDGAMISLHKYLKAPMILAGLSLPEHGYHAPNENFDWNQASKGMQMLIHYFENVCAL
jgi:acetylornithine deacetylase/succinyl-diaminopimelate desuccinylase-like protein